MRHVLPQYRTMRRELQHLGLRRSALNLDRSVLDAHWLPFSVVLVFIRIGRIQLLQVQVLLIDGEDGEPPRDAFVVTSGHSRQRRFAGSDYIPSRSVQMNDVAQGRHRDYAMWIVSQNRLARLSQLAGDCPVIAANGIRWRRKLNAIVAPNQLSQ